MIAGSPRALIPTGKIRVVIVDDHRLLRQGLSRLLSAEPGVEVGGEAANGQEAANLVRQLRPDVATSNDPKGGVIGHPGAAPGALFVAGDAVLATNKFTASLPAANLWMLATY